MMTIHRFDMSHMRHLLGILGHKILSPEGVKEEEKKKDKGQGLLCKCF